MKTPIQVAMKWLWSPLKGERQEVNKVVTGILSWTPLIQTWLFLSLHYFKLKTFSHFRYLNPMQFQTTSEFKILGFNCL